MSRKKVENTVEEIALPILQELNYELVDLEFKKEGSNWFLRIYIDKPGGITLDDCQLASEKLNVALDALDPIPYRYYFEVSSPGLDRPLKKVADFERYKGSKVEVKLYKPMNGKKVFTGNLVGLENNMIIVDDGDQLNQFNRNDVAIIRLSLEF